MRNRCIERSCPHLWRTRRGAVLAKVAIVLPVLIGMIGLVVDVGLLFSAHRQVHNAADAAALAAAVDLVRGKTADQARETAQTFVRQYNALGNAEALVAGQTFNWPPLSGPYAGHPSYVEVIVTFPVQTLFIQVLGVDRNRVATARAVAGFEPVAAGEGVMVLDRNARPGLRTSSANASLRVNGRIVVNSEGGGVDETGTVLPGTGNAATAGSGGIYGTDIQVVGGVNSPTYFMNFVAGDPSPLRCRALPEPDPLINLPTPTTSNGADPTKRGTVSVTNNGSTLSGDEGGLNFRAVGGESLGNGLYTAEAGQVILYPGIYQNIAIQGGNVRFMPGIYVLAATKTNDGFKVTGGTVVGQGIMIYSTGSNYNSGTGMPDAGDGEQPPPNTDGAVFGGVDISAAIALTPIDTKAYQYASMYTGAKQISNAYNGMLFYQRRRSNAITKIVGNSATGGLTGTLYGKWGRFDISGQGSYAAQFIVGSMDITGSGTVRILGGGSALGRANRVFLVE
ncbi:MAG TPA: pilus assembly protein TadG-related protein [Tepidisphaeraceae bacterium]|nr:pilus assembly protein TadG-related protein [Tepidisphaeraceae bacterium]